MDRFVKLDKPDFIGKAAAVKERAEGPKRTRVFLEVDALDADVMGDEPIWVDGQVVGWVTSGGYGHFVRQSLAQGYIPTGLVRPDLRLEVEILGERRPGAPADEPRRSTRTPCACGCERAEADERTLFRLVAAQARHGRPQGLGARLARPRAQEALRRGHRRPVVVTVWRPPITWRRTTA